MRPRRRVPLLAVTVGAVLPGTASAAILDVRADVANGLDRPIELQVYRGGEWQAVRTLDPDESQSGITNRSSTLQLRVVGCGRVRFDNPPVTRPHVMVIRNRQSTTPTAFSEGDVKDVGLRSALRFTVRRLDDSDDFKEFAATLRACDPLTDDGAE